MYVELICIVIGAVIGILGTLVLASKGEPANGNGDEHPPDLSGEHPLTDFPYEKSTWKGLALRIYPLGGNSYQLDKVNLTIDKGLNQRWHGINQCLFYISDEAIPNKPELYELRMNCNSNLTPWHVKETLVKKKTGRYFIIGFTNNHDFEADGVIVINKK